MLSMLLPLLLLLLGCSSDSTGNKVGYSAYFVILCLRPSNRLFIFYLLKHRRQRAEATYMPVKSVQ